MANDLYLKYLTQGFLYNNYCTVPSMSHPVLEKNQMHLIYAIWSRYGHTYSIDVISKYAKDNVQNANKRVNKFTTLW